MSIEMQSRQATLYVVLLRDGKTYETFDHDKAVQREAYFSAGIPAAECTDCKAVIPISLIDMSPGTTVDYAVGGRVRRLANACPQTTSLHFPGHRVSRDDYKEAQ